MPRPKMLGKNRADKSPKILPARERGTGRFLSGRPIKILGNERGKILGNKKRRS